MISGAHILLNTTDSTRFDANFRGSKLPAAVVSNGMMDQSL